MIKISDDELIKELQTRFALQKKSVDELQRLNNILTKVNNRLSEAEAMKSHFISNISNEIVNPFTSILALSKTILEVEKENWKKVVSMIALIHSEAFNLDFQFKNIFAAARIEAGEVYPEISKVNIKGIIDETVESFKYEAKKRRLTVEIINMGSDSQTKQFFKTDPDKLQIIVFNLLSNAIKFSHEGGKVLIEWQQNDKGLIIKVKDYGAGISKENQDIIFDRFKRLDSGINSINRGHGLGLSVVKAYIDLLEGTISLVTSPGKGSEFRMSIPESEAESEGFTMDGNELLFEEDTF